MKNARMEERILSRQDTPQLYLPLRRLCIMNMASKVSGTVLVLIPVPQLLA